MVNNSLLKPLDDNETVAVPVPPLDWREREALVIRLFEADEVPSESDFAVLQTLAHDPKWEVRRRVAEMLERLSEERFLGLAAQLCEDANAYVSRAATRALERRRKGKSSPNRRRSVVEGLASDYAVMERLHGAGATRMSRQIAERLYDLLVGATIHNMRGLLTPAGGTAQSLLKRLDKGKLTAAELKRQLSRILAATQDLSHLLDEVRSFAQPVPVDRRPERLDPLLQESLENARAGFARGGHDADQILVSLDCDELTIAASKVHLIVAFTNLLQNAFDAFRPRLSDGGEMWISILAHSVNPDSVEIRIEDNGVGFGEEDLRQIRQFIPGQKTLKQDGTGFGLPTAKRYIEAHGGTLTIDSREHHGTQVRIQLPLASEEEGQP